MNVIAQYCFGENRSWSTPFSATPCYSGGCAYFPYRLPGAIGCVKLYPNGTAAMASAAVPAGKSVHHPGGWRIFTWKGRIILSCGNSADPVPGVTEMMKSQLFFDLNTMEIVDLPENVAEANLCLPPIRETEDVTLNGYVMQYKNSRSYHCISPDGTVLWEEKHKGYRYTPFEEINGCVMFGTAGGHGGGLYCYRLADGECLCSVDTKGTARYCWHNGNVLSRGRNGELLWIDPFSGLIKDRMVLDSGLNDDSGIFTDGRYVCVTGFRKQKDQMLPSFYLIDTQDCTADKTQ